MITRPVFIISIVCVLQACTQPYSVFNDSAKRTHQRSYSSDASYQVTIRLLLINVFVDRNFKIT